MVKINKWDNKRENKKSNALLYGLLAGVGLLVFYISVLSIFQDFNFAISNFKSLWYWIIPLVAGFGTQIGLYASIRHTAQLTATAAGTGSVSAGSMIACCSHFLLNIIPIVGFSGIALFLMQYQKWFFTIGIISNAIGIAFLLNHKNKMKGGRCNL